MRLSHLARLGAGLLRCPRRAPAASSISISMGGQDFRVLACFLLKDPAFGLDIPRRCAEATRLRHFADAGLQGVVGSGAIRSASGDEAAEWVNRRWSRLAAAESERFVQPRRTL